MLLLVALVGQATFAAGAGKAPAPAATAPVSRQLVAVATIPVGADPTGVAVDPGTHAVYVTNRGDDTVSVVEAASKRVIATIPVGRRPNGLAIHTRRHRLFVADEGSDDLSVIDTATNRVTGTVAIGAGPMGVAVDPTAGRVYITEQDPIPFGPPSGAVRAVDIATGCALAPASMGVVGSDVGGIAVDPARHAVYVPVAARSTPTFIALLDSPALRTVSGNSGFAGSFGVAVDVATQTAYVTATDFFFPGSPRRDGVAAVDEATGRVVATVPTGDRPWGVAVDPGTHLVYVANQLGHSLTVIAGVTRPAEAAPGTR